MTMPTDVDVAEEGKEILRRVGCPTSMDHQLDALRLLSPGWFDESSPTFEGGALACAARLLGGLLGASQLPNPYLYP